VPAVIPLAFTLTVSVEGVDAEAGLTLSQDPPDVAVEKLRTPALLEIDRF